jgi:hypothetical protein
MDSDEPRDSRGRFPKGHSGNRAGRPRRDKTVASAILKAMNETVTANENGRKRKVRKIDATAKQFANKGASGDIRAGKLLLDMATRAEAQQLSAGPADMPLTHSDQEILERFLADYRKHLEEGGA